MPLEHAMNNAISHTDSPQPSLHCTVAIVGGGTSGLALAAELKRLNVGRVIVLEREAQAGGVPRHCGHYPFGLREYGRLLKGPQYADKNVNAASELGVEILTGTTVTALHPAGRLSLSNASGPHELQAQRVVLCTGVRESSRAQRFIGGDRPLGVVSTGALQSLVYLQGLRPFNNPVILGSELVSFSAIGTCQHLGIKPLAMIEEKSRIITHQALQPYLMLKRVPLYLSAQSVNIIGKKQVEAIEFTDTSGQLQRIKTDGVIISGRFRPEAALLRQSHLRLDLGSGGPAIDQFGQCSDPSYYSSGNLLRPAETSGWCWQEGIATARRIAQDLAEPHTSHGTVTLSVADPAIKFILPQRLTLSARTGGMQKLQIGLHEPVKEMLQASVNNQVIWQTTLRAQPVRRILKPLPPVLKNHAGAEVTFSIKRES